MREGEARKIEEESLPPPEKTVEKEKKEEEKKELTEAMWSIKRSGDMNPLISLLQSAKLSDIEYRKIILDQIAYDAPEKLKPLLGKLLATIEGAPTESGAHLLIVLADLAHFGIHYYSSSDMMAEAKDMLRSFAVTTRSVLLKRKAQSLIEEGEGVWARKKFQSKKINTEKKFDTADISISDLNLSTPDGALYKLSRDEAIVMPVSKNFLGVFDRQFGFNCLLEKKGEKTYSGQEIINPKDLQMLSDAPDLTEASRVYRSQAQRDYLMLLDMGVIEGIERDYGFSFRDLSLREQIWFASYLRELKIDDEKIIQEFTNKFGLFGAKAFLSCEYGRQQGGAILTIAESLDQKSVRSIFEKYSEIVDITENIYEFLHTSFSRERNFSNEIVDEIIENLLRHGKNLLTKFADKVQVAKNQGQKIDSEVILEQLENIKAEILLFASTFKAVSAEQKIDFRDVAGTELKTADSGELATEEKKEMERIFVENRSTYPPKLLASSKKEFIEALSVADKKFYLLSHGGNLVSFMRLDQLPSGNLYAGSLNVRPEVRGSAIGSAMLKTVLDQEARNHTIEAVVYEKNPMLKHYLGDFGFKVVGEIPDYEGTGQKFLKIERPREKKITSAKRRAAAWPEAA